MLSEISNTQKNKCVMIPLILVPMVVKIQIEGRIQAAKGWEREDEEFMFKVDCFSLERWKRSGDGRWWRLYNTMNVPNAAELYT